MASVATYTLAIVGFIGLVHSAGDPKGNTQPCQHLKKYRCGEAVYTEAEIREANPDANGILSRDLDLSKFGINMTELLGRRAVGDSDEDAHEALSEALSEALLLDGDDYQGDALAAYHQLVARGKENWYPLCESELGSGSGVIYWIPPYPAGTDFYDNYNWNDCTEFRFGVNQGMRNHGSGYHAEHVLERQLIKEFVRETLENKPLANPIAGQPGMTYCRAFYEYWMPKNPNNPNDPAMVNGLPAFDYVGSQWPSTTSHKDEMVQCAAEVNTAKARAFGLPSIFADDGLMKEIQNNNNWYHLNHILKVSLMLAKYLDNDQIQDILRAQGDRVTTAFKHAESELAKTRPDYVPQNLDAAWHAWIKAKMDKVDQRLHHSTFAWKGDVEANADTSRGRRDLDAVEREFITQADATVNAINNWNAGMRRQGRQMVRNPW